MQVLFQNNIKIHKFLGFGLGFPTMSKDGMS